MRPPRCRRSCATRASAVAAGSASWGGRRTASRETIEVPAFLVDELRRAVGASGSVESATDLLIDPATGLRVVNEIEQLAAFEWAACQTSHGVRRVLTGLEPGMTERDCRAAAGLERHPAVLPPDAHGRSTGAAGVAEPGRPAHRAGRPLHHRVRDLGRAELPGRLRGRGQRPSWRRALGTTSIASSRRTSPRSPSGTARSTSGSRAERCSASSTVTWAIRSSGST